MSNEKIKSEGKCLFCEKTFAKAGINRHLKTHLEEKENEETAKLGKSYFVKVEVNPRWGTTPYFLSLWVDGNAEMGDIDDFLRAIWLECCGHMSAFRNPAQRRQGGWDFFEAIDLMAQGKTKEYEKLMEESNGEIPMSRKVNKVFRKDLKLEYEYDFGSSTELQLTVIDEFSIKADDDVVLLSRNEPPKILCDCCKKAPATVECTVHDWDENSLFCPKCAKKHAKECNDFDDYAAMPVVNSPRMGVCGYEGGTIDTERDRVSVE